jgi:hypothetical protein
VNDAAGRGKVRTCEEDDVDNSSNEEMRKCNGPCCFVVALPVTHIWCSLLRPYGKTTGKRTPIVRKVRAARRDGPAMRSGTLQRIRVRPHLALEVQCEAERAA